MNNNSTTAPPNISSGTPPITSPVNPEPVQPEYSSETPPLPGPIAAEPKKPNKSIIIILSVVIVVILGVIAYMMLKQPEPKPAEPVKPDQNEQQTPEPEETPEPEGAPSEDSSSEVTITDQYVKNDLNRKISILNGIADTTQDDKNLLNNMLAYNEVSNFYSRGFESATEKAGAVFISSLGSFETENGGYHLGREDDLGDYIRANFASEVELIEDGRITISTISYDAANKLYMDMFNEPLPKEDIITRICGKDFFYVQSVDQFLMTPVSGCGGSGWSGILVRKDSYTAKNDEAYVYVKIASAHLDEGASGWVVYDDFYSNLENAKSEGKVINSPVAIYNGLLHETPANNSFMDEATDYRFVFKKGASGTYYFDRLEKL